MKNVIDVVRCLIFMGLIVPWAAVMAETVPGDGAKEILEATGFKGGLIVHLGCGDGVLTAALGGTKNVVVHGLDADQKNVDKARAYIRSKGLYGSISIAKIMSERLPYAENIVTLFVTNNLGNVSMEEVLRVLEPRGVAYIKKNGAWLKTVKPVPANIDEWSHFLHGPDNNAVAKDSVVDAPKYIQWLGDPKWGRNHLASSITTVISASGRLFAVVDEGAPLGGAKKSKKAPPTKWYLIARDAFNGIVLWKKKFEVWFSPMRGFKNSLLRFQRRMVASGDRVYITMALNGPISEIDAVTGETIREYEGTNRTNEFVVVEDLLIVLAQNESTDLKKKFSPRIIPNILRAINKDTGDVLWERGVNDCLDGTLAVRDGRVFYSDDDGFFVVDLKTGEVLWQIEALTNKANDRTSLGITLVVGKDVVLYADGKTLFSRSVKDGTVLWKVPCPPSYHNPTDVFIIGGLVWAAEDGSMYNSSSFSIGRDPLTGEIKKKIPAKEVWLKGDMGHHRCYRNKATDRFVLVGQTGTGFLDLKSGLNQRHDWVRGTCAFGVLPCNGLLYAPSHACACYIEGKINGFWALAGDTARKSKEDLSGSGVRLETVTVEAESATEITDTNDEDWPTFRHDALRSGAASTEVSSTLKQLWKIKFEGTLSTMVCANDRLFVADTDRHAVYALDANKGTQLWRFTAGGIVDSPPIISQGRAVFGSRDGWVYCVRASDGKLLWRFRGAPEERNVIVKGRMESVWPIHGSVLILENTVYFAAGRSSFLDGGIFLYRLNLLTGEEISKTNIYAPDEETGLQPTPFRLTTERKNLIHPLKVALPDILSSDGTSIYMLHTRFDYKGALKEGIAPHLYASAGYLNKSWFHRAYWSYADNFGSGATSWERPGEFSPAGRILVMNDSFIFGFGRASFRESAQKMNYSLFSSLRKNVILKKGLLKGMGRVKAEVGKMQRLRGEYRNFRWSNKISISVRALLLAKDKLFAAGQVGDILQSQDAREGKNGSLLWVANAESGEKLSEIKLDAPPVFDGMIAARGKIYIALKDRTIVCLGE